MASAELSMGQNCWVNNESDGLSQLSSAEAGADPNSKKITTMIFLKYRSDHGKIILFGLQ
jgi:hypothetical protein